MLSSITKKGEIESTSAPWVILVINVNISLVGLIFLPSIFQISSTLELHGHGQEDVETLQDATDKYWQKLKTLHFSVLVIQDHIESIGKPILLKGDEVLPNGILAQVFSDIAPKPSATFSAPHMSKTPSQSRPHRFDLSGVTEFI